MHAGVAHTYHADMPGVRVFLLLLALLPTFRAHGGGVRFNETETDQRANALMTSFWEWHLQEFPEFATEMGVRGYDDRVTDYTEDAFQRRVRNATTFVHSINELANHGDVSHVTRASLAVMEDMLQTFVEGFRFRFQTVYLPLQIGINPLHSWHYVLKRQRLESEEDYENLLRRYSKIPQQFQQMVNMTKDATEKGYLRNTLGLQETMETLQGQVTMRAEDSLFYEPFNNMPSAISYNTQEDLRQRARTVINDEILPALWAYKHYMLKKYLPAAQAVPIGVYALPDGQALYRQYLNYHLSIPMTPEQVHQLGREEVNRVKDKVLQWVKLKKLGNFSAVNTGRIFRQLFNRSDLYYEDSDAMYDAYTKLGKKIHNQLPELLLRVPGTPYRIERTYSGPEGTYTDPSSATQGAGVFNANVGPPYGPKMNLASIMLHELEPGHHTQSSFLQANYTKELPLFRRNLDYSNSFAVPFHFPIYTAYSEGWALYAEYLGEEMGLLDEPLTRLARYNNEMLRACRMVVDTGIHAYGWSISKAEEYLSFFTGLTQDKIKLEVNRYIGRPGRACSYKIGERKILELRRRAEEVLGDLFDKRHFHDRLLSLGPVPLRVLEEEMYYWMAEVNGVLQGPDDNITAMVTSGTVHAIRINIHCYILVLMLSIISQVPNW